MTEQSHGIIQARVSAVHRERYAVLCEQGALFARLKTAAYADAPPLSYPTVGDMVDLLPKPIGDSLIVGTRARQSLFARKMPGKTMGEQAVAANFDEVYMLASLNRDFNPRRIERYAALVWQSGGTPVTVLTKLDLTRDAGPQLAAASAAAPGVDVYAVSARTGEGLSALRERLSPGKMIALMGSSGVGKSSLVNALAGETLMDVGDIREEDARGRHTTTHRQLFELPGGALVIDTPGMREIGLWDAEEGVRGAFEDIDTLARGCRFTDCAHGAEPGCAVKRAIEEGLLDAGRLKSYEKLRREAERRRRMEMRRR